MNGIPELARVFLQCVALFLNAVVFTYLVSCRHRLLKKPHYLLILIFNISVVVLTALLLIMRYLPRFSSRSHLYLDIVSDSAEKTLEYFTVCLVMVMGINEMAAFHSGKLLRIFRKRKYLLWPTIVLLFASVLGALCTSDFFLNINTIENPANPLPDCLPYLKYVENFFTVLSVVTCVFFLVAFFELREQRCSAVSHVTKNMLERAETMLFRQSCFILCCAMVSVIMRVVIHVVGYDTVDYPTMLYVEKVVNNSTQIAIAVIVMLSTDFRNFVRNRVFRAAGSPYETGLPSVFTKCPSRPIRAPATGCI